jgi:hypothetical protein
VICLNIPTTKKNSQKKTVIKNHFALVKAEKLWKRKLYVSEKENFFIGFFVIFVIDEFSIILFSLALISSPRERGGNLCY